MEKHCSSSKKYKTLFTDTAAFTISNFASKILVFLLLPLYTAILSTEEYGIADLITNTVNVVYPILTLSIMEATLRFAFDKDVNKEDVLSNSLFVIFISEAIIVVATPLIRYVSSEMFDYWGWFALIFLGSNIQQVLSQYVKGIGKTKNFAISGVIQTVVMIAGNIITLVILKWRVFGYLFSIAAGYFVASLYLIVAAKIKIKRIRINRSLLGEMLQFSIPTIPTIVAWWISTSADKYIIIAYLGIAASGVYSVSYKIPSILTMFTSLFTSAWTLSAIQNVDEQDNAQFHTVVYQYFNIANVLACSALILLSQIFAQILFGKEFYIAWHYVPLLLVAYVFSGLAGFLSGSFRAAKETKGLFSSTVIGAIVNILLNFYFIKKFGNMGAAITTMIGFAVTFYIRSQSVKKIIDIKINLIKDSVVYLLLIVQALTMSLEVTYSYIFGVSIFLIIVILYWKEISQIIIKINILIKRKISEGKV